MMSTEPSDFYRSTTYRVQTVHGSALYAANTIRGYTLNSLTGEGGDRSVTILADPGITGITVLAAEVDDFITWLDRAVRDNAEPMVLSSGTLDFTPAEPVDDGVDVTAEQFIRMEIAKALGGAVPAAHLVEIADYAIFGTHRTTAPGTVLDETGEPIF